MIDRTRTPMKFAYVLLTLMALDVFTTVIGVNLGHAEQNPLVHLIGLKGLFFMKAIMAIVVLGYARKTGKLDQEQRESFCLVVAVLCLVHVVVVRSNIMVITGG